MVSFQSAPTYNGSGQILHKGKVYYDYNRDPHILEGATATIVSVSKKDRMTVQHGVVGKDGKLKMIEWTESHPSR